MPASPTRGADPRAEVLRRIELTVNRRLDGLLHGDHRGLVPGEGWEAGDSRPYVPGDDVRRIDWNVTARSADVHVRTSIADRELETWVVVDRSPSMGFGTVDHTKAELATHLVGAVGVLAARAQNRLGAILVEPGGVRTVPARAGRDHLMALLWTLLDAPTPSPVPSSTPHPATTSLHQGLAHVLVPPRRRGLVVVVSDFLTPSSGGGDPDWVAPVRVLAHRHHVLAAEIVDPRELRLPAVGLLRVVDTETGRFREVPTNRRVRERYARAADRQRETTAAHLRDAGAEHLVLRTDRDWVLDLVAFLDRRRRERHR